MDPRIELCKSLFLPAYLKYTCDEYDMDGKYLYTTYKYPYYDSREKLENALRYNFDEYIKRMHDIEIVQADLYRAEVKEVLKDINSKKHAQVYEQKLRALTISPPAPYSDSHTNLERYITFLKDKCPFITIRNYVYEQRSEAEDLEHGWHIHATVSSSYAPSKIAQYLKQKQKSNKISFNLNVKDITSIANWDSYIGNGCAVDKHNESKAAAVKKDAVLREKYNIPKIFYISNIEQNGLQQ